MTPDDFPLPCEERPLRYLEAATGPMDLLRDALARQAHGHREEIDRLLAAVALAQFQMDRAAGELTAGAAESATEMMTLIAANLRDLLDPYGVRVDDPTGRDWTPEARSAADVRGYQARPDLAEPRVAHTETPAIFRKDRLLAKGAVSLEGPPRG